MTFEMGQVIELVVVISGFAGTIYTLKADVNSIRGDVNNLEKKQDKYNHLQERTLKSEQTTNSIVLRLDRKDEHCNKKDEQYDKIIEKIDDVKDLMMDHVQIFHTKKGND